MILGLGILRVINLLMAWKCDHEQRNTQLNSTFQQWTAASRPKPSVIDTTLSIGRSSIWLIAPNYEVLISVLAFEHYSTENRTFSANGHKDSGIFR